MAILSGYPGIISFKQILLIMEQLNKCICKVYSYDGGFSTGFFCFIPYNNKKFPALIVNNHLINEDDINIKENISFEFNNENKKINIKDNRIIYTNPKYDITIIEINPDKDFIYNFLDLDKNIFKDKLIFSGQSIYIPQCEKRLSFGIIKGLSDEDDRIYHLCCTDKCSGGSPIMNLSNGKIIGIHLGSSVRKNYNLGTYLNKPILEFFGKFKDYLNSKQKIISKTYSIGEGSIISKNEEKILNFENQNKINENELKNEIEKNKILEEKIIQLQKLLNNNNNKNNSNLDRGNSNDVLEAILKKDKEIEELKLKLSRFPFELAEGEKLMSIIITSKEQKFHHSIICKNTDNFCNIEIQLYNAYPEYSDSANIFTVNGNRIKRNNSLEENQIKNNDNIVLTTIDI